MDLDSALHSSDDTIKQLLGQARSAINACDASSALQCVVQALQLIRGDDAVLPTLRNAAQHYHEHRIAPIEEISALLSHVTIQAEQQQAPQHQQQMQQMQHHQSAHAIAPAPQHQTCPMQQQLQQQQPLQYTHQQHPQQQCPGPGAFTPHAHSTPILDETGRGDIASLALQDGSYWQCPHCGGVVPLQRQHAHLQTWCPAAHGSNSDDMQ